MTNEAPTRAVPVWRRSAVIVPVATLALVAAALLDTTFVDSGSIAEPADTAVEYVELNFDTVVIPTIIDDAQPLTELVTELVDDPEAVGEEFGKREDEGKPYSFSTSVTGTVAEGGFGEVGLEVDGIPEGITVGVAIPPLGSVTTIRVAGTELTFGDFVNQTEYQRVAIELNTRLANTVLKENDLTTMTGQEVTIVGAFTWVSKTGGEIDHVTVIPVQIEVGA